MMTSVGSAPHSNPASLRGGSSFSEQPLSNFDSFSLFILGCQGLL
ncbi:hypothetical protein CAEBREN_20569 [Caenorhabditis brenneri]|uniref:Uncharacterized protein n=1 Tax=Caenorhabditis brenneri TaxID=135651 RepID=G0MPG0_CAEBE|nr:hypothetical protein CAEBREN_20569 [Caenorhabditis brenneri]